jgi:hypothetical protein
MRLCYARMSSRSLNNKFKHCCGPGESAQWEVREVYGPRPTGAICKYFNPELAAGTRTT